MYDRSSLEFGGSESAAFNRSIGILQPLFDWHIYRNTWIQCIYPAIKFLLPSKIMYPQLSLFKESFQRMTQKYRHCYFDPLNLKICLVEL